MIFDLLYLLSLDESYSFDDEYDELGSESGSSGTYSFYNFSLHFDDSVGSVSVLGSDVSAPTGVDPKGDIFASDISVPTSVESKGGQLLEMFWRSNSLFSFQI